MIFVLAILSQIVIFTSANPFHKYPFVFLLDVGNEELDKTNTEQIRISSPGGTLAFRYPGIGYGDTIGHVRVSGIDFGTDLKADINDGGPGYNYIVLVFKGNPGVPYDAVITIQTVNDTGYDNQDTKEAEGKHNEVNSNVGDKDENTSAEDINDDSETTYAMNNKEELKQSSSNVYNYLHSQTVPRNYESRASLNDNNKSEDLHESNAGRDVEEGDLSEEGNSKEPKRDDEENSYRNIEIEERKDEISRNIDNEENQKENTSADNQISTDYVEKLSERPNTDTNYEEPNRYEISNTENEESYQDESSNDEKNTIFANINVQREDIASEKDKDRTQTDQVTQNDDSLAESSSDGDYDDSAYSAGPSEIDQMFNDEEVHNEPVKDKNNGNFYDNDGRNAVDY